MGLWDIMLIRELEEHNNVSVKMYKRHKDDIDIILGNNNGEYIQEERKDFEERSINHIKGLAD